MTLAYTVRVRVACTMAVTGAEPVNHWLGAGEYKGCIARLSQRLLSKLVRAKFLNERKDSHPHSYILPSYSILISE